MSILAYAQGGASGVSGPSALTRNTPFANYRDVRPDFSRAWVEEFLDALGIEIDILDAQFVAAQARSNILDPTFTPSLLPTTYQATSIAAPTASALRDTMLDVLLYIAGTPYPAASNLTTAQKQALVIAGWDLLRYKGTRLRLNRLVALYGDGVVSGYTSSAFNIACILTDGDPTPGWGDWVPSATGINELVRPWALTASRDHLVARLAPAWSEIGVGFSQFRAGYSAAGEPVLTASARLNLMLNEHFLDWTAGDPDSWDLAGTGTLTQNTVDPSINWEFSASCAKINLAAAAAGITRTLSQGSTPALVINDQIAYRLQIDYSYRQAALPFLSVLTARVTDLTNTLYWNPTSAAWQSTAYDIPLPPSSSAGARTRYATTITPSVASASAVTRGQSTIRVGITATSDGTASTQIAFQVYRVGLYEAFDFDGEEEAGGDRTLWLPLEDAIGVSTYADAGGGAVVIENANGVRSTYKSLATGIPVFPYHPAISTRGYQSRTRWTNLLKGSDSFTGDWTATNVTVAAAAYAGPEIGTVALTQPSLTLTTAGGSYAQSNIVADASSKDYIAGIWVKKVTADTTTPAATLTLTAGSVTADASAAVFAASWVGLTITVGGRSYEIATFVGATQVTLATAAAVTVTAQAFTISTTDVTLNLQAVGGVTSVSRTFRLKQSEGWRWIAMQAVSFGALDAFPLRLTLTWMQALANGVITVATGYCYAVTGKTGVTYPPVCKTAVAGTAYCAENVLTANVSGAGLFHPLTLRRLVSLKEGVLDLTVVPTFDASSQPAGTIFAFGPAVGNDSQLILDVSGGTLRARYGDIGGTLRNATLTLTASDSPTAAQCTWKRDTAIPIRLRWSALTGLDLSAGGGIATQVSAIPWGYTETVPTLIAIGSSLAGASQFDGTITDLEVLQVGFPT